MGELDKGVQEMAHSRHQCFVTNPNGQSEKGQHGEIHPSNTLTAGEGRKITKLWEGNLNCRRLVTGERNINRN